jgi:16S rRNA C967 or C1407 C5-methylase (RsmB/RsmF family)
VNPNNRNYESIVEKLSKHEFLAEHITQEGLEGGISLRKVEWYPHSLTWELSCSRREMKKTEGFKSFNKFLVSATAAGLITRQELVSMLPPLILDVAPGMKVLDMCAAPGSKTAQIVEYLAGSGLIMANDVDTNRAYMLIH